MNNVFTENDLLLEAVELEPEHFQQAAQISNQIIDESDKWQTYLNSLSLAGFEQWLKERKPELQVNKNKCSILQPQYAREINAVCNLQVEELTVCLIHIDALHEGFVNLPKAAVDLPEFVAHFYVLIAVLEEQGEVRIDGFLTYNQLNNYRQSANLQTSENKSYQLPLSLFKSQPSQLLLYLSFVAPSAIPLPVSSEASYVADTINAASQSLLNLSQWLNGAFDAGWQAVENILTPNQVSFAFRFRDGSNQKVNTSQSDLSNVKRGKLFNFGIEQSGESVALLIGLITIESTKIKVSVELYPTKGQTYLPPDLQLMVLDETGLAIMQAQTRNTNKDISLDFTANSGEQFGIKIVLNNVSITEYFLV